MTKLNTDVDATATAGEPAGAANRSLPIAKIAPAPNVSRDAGTKATTAAA